MYKAILPGRLTVGREVLVLAIGVRIPARQPSYMNDKDKSKTPTKYVGIRPDSVGFEEDFDSWNGYEKLEYIRYLERDTYRYAFKLFFPLGVLVGIFVGFILYKLWF